MYKVRFKVASNDSYFTFIFLKIFESNRKHTVFRPLSGFEIWPIHLFSSRSIFDQNHVPIIIIQSAQFIY